MKKIIVIFILSSLTLFSQTYNDVYKLGQQNIDYDARTLSLGNSTIGSLGNFSSALINPAGIGTIRRDIFSISFNSNTFNNNTTFFGNLSEDKRTSANINAISLVMPLDVKKGNVVFAFGYNQVRDFNSTIKFDGFNNSNTSLIQTLTAAGNEIPFELYLSNPVKDSNDNTLFYETLINGKLNQNGETFEEGEINNWVISTAFQAGKNLYLGATINFIGGNYLNNRRYTEKDASYLYQGFLDPGDAQTEDFEWFTIKDIVDWDLSGWDARLGFLYYPNKNFSIGGTVKFPTFYTVKEKYLVDGESYFKNYIFEKDFPEQNLEYEIVTPMEFSGGFSATLPFFSLNAAVTYTDYTQMEFDNVSDNDELNEQNKIIKDIFTSTLKLNFGAEFSLPSPVLKLRGGFIYLPSPYKEDDSSFDKKFVTAGVGLPLSKSLLFDFAFIHGWWQNVGDNYDYNVSRTYQEIKTNKFVFSFSYVF
ncbi:MAG: hypothetical protein CR986_05615 [Ignavibacteriae bacterium]|nr:MAG: hypothetical protein CR986_05615 [Ignavibacteriota bacterium]